MIFSTNEDPRTQNFWLISSFYNLLLIILIYLISILIIFPNIQVIYRRGGIISKIIISADFLVSFSSLIVGILILTEDGNYCNPSQSSYRMVCTMYTYFWIKCVELLDTVFSVIRRRELAVDHVAHHILMVVVSFIAVKYTPGGIVAIPVLLNCIHHFMMYGYYLLSFYMDRPPWARTLIDVTKFAQFVVVFLTGIYSFKTRCIPAWASTIWTGIVVVFLIIILIKHYCCGPPGPPIVNQNNQDQPPREEIRTQNRHLRVTRNYPRNDNNPDQNQDRILIMNANFVQKINWSIHPRMTMPLNMPRY